MPLNSKLATLKTKPTTVSVEEFLNAIEEEEKRKDSFALLKLMKTITGEEPVLWSNSTIGFGCKRFKSAATGREVDWFVIGFAPRKANLSLHINVGAMGHEEALTKLGKHKTGQGCLYINKLADVDTEVLKGMIATSFNRV